MKVTWIPSSHFACDSPHKAIVLSHSYALFVPRSIWDLGIHKQTVGSTYIQQLSCTGVPRRLTFLNHVSKAVTIRRRNISHHAPKNYVYSEDPQLHLRVRKVGGLRAVRAARELERAMRSYNETRTRAIGPLLHLPPAEGWDGGRPYGP